jgi:hypothetical protein
MILRESLVLYMLPGSGAGGWYVLLSGNVVVPRSGWTLGVLRLMKGHGWGAGSGC